MTASVAPTGLVRGVSQRRVLKSEWIKLRSLRSTWFSFAAALLISSGLGMLIAGLRGHDYAQHRFDFKGPGELFDATQASLRGIYLAQLAIGVLGVLLITGEYATGMIKASLTAVPRRVPVLLAKVAVFGAVTYVVTSVMCLCAFLGGQAVLTSDNLGVSLSSPGAVRAVFGGALFVTVVGLLGLGFGFILRNTGGAIASLFGVVLVLPLLAQALPQSWQDHVDKYLPLNILNRMIATTHPDSNQLRPGVGALMLVLYTVVVLGAGLATLRSRDA